MRHRLVGRLTPLPKAGHLVRFARHHHAAVRRAMNALRQSGLVLEIDALLLDHEWAVIDLGVDGADVLAHDADEQQLYGAEEVDADQDRRQAVKSNVFQNTSFIDR